ncbi:Phosphatase and actin regulator 4-B, partial [Ophiophagus hannah]
MMKKKKKKKKKKRKMAQEMPVLPITMFIPRLILQTVQDEDEGPSDSDSEGPILYREEEEEEEDEDESHNSKNLSLSSSLCQLKTTNPTPATIITSHAPITIHPNLRLPLT